MKKIILCTGLILFILIISIAPLYTQEMPEADEKAAEETAQEATKKLNALDKLGRGMVNLFVSPLELFQSIGEGVEEYDYAVGLGVGIPKGAWRTVRRAGFGIFEIITFPFPIKGTYEQLIEEPQFFKSKE